MILEGLPLELVLLQIELAMHCYTLIVIMSAKEQIFNEWFAVDIKNAKNEVTGGRFSIEYEKLPI